MKKSNGCLKTFNKLFISKLHLAGFLSCAMGISIYSNGLPGGYLVNQMWRDVHSVHSPLTNVAFFTDVQYLSVYLGHAATPLSGYQTSESVLLLPLGRIHTLGFTYEGSGSHIEAGKGNRWADDGTILSNDKKLSDRSNAFILSYATNPWKALSVGVNAQLYYHPVFEESVTGFGGDVAFAYKVANHEKLGSHSLGVSTHNILQAGATGYSSSLVISWYAFMLDNKLESQLDFSLKDFLAKSSDFIDNGTSLDFDLSYKLGFWLYNVVKMYGLAGTKYVGVSGGLTVPYGYADRKISVLYQLAMPFGGDLPSHSFFAGAEFGEPRKESVEKAQKRQVGLLPSNLYTKAMQLYSEGNYWDAFWIFSKLLAEYPDFIKNDWVSYYSGRCLEKLDIRTSSLSQYQRTLIKYSKSKVIPYVNSGVMNLQYRQDNTAGVEEYYSQLINAHVPDSLKNHAHYLMGETFFKEKNYDKAIETLSKVQNNHVDYMYARHTMAVASVMNENFDKALDYVKDCLSVNSKTPADEELVYRTYLFTGYLFYEDKEYANALAALSMIPKRSLYYEDALLGMGWIALRAQQWEDCLGAARDLKSISRWVVNQGEGSLLEAYVHLMRKDYDQAASILSAASAMLNAASPPSQEEFQTHLNSYQGVRTDYESLGRTADAFAMEKQTTELIEKIDSLHIDQKEMKVKIEEHYKYVDEFNRGTFFSRNLATVRDDVDYALARALNMSSLKKARVEQDKSEKKAQDIDKEIEKLKEKMKDGTN